jgi:hypothetical protein
VSNTIYNDDLHYHSKRLTCFKAVFLNVLAAESKEGLHTDIETGLAVLKRTNVKPWITRSPFNVENFIQVLSQNLNMVPNHDSNKTEPFLTNLLIGTLDLGQFLASPL